MKRAASLTLVFGILLFSASAVLGQTCPNASHAASKAAQDYRAAVGKVQTGCNSSVEECNQRRAVATEALGLVNAANEAVLTACTFSDLSNKNDDLLPVTQATVMAAIDSLPESVAVPCDVITELGISIGCPYWILNVPRSNVSVSTATATSFNYSLNLNASASIPVNGAFSCTLTASTSTGVPVSGTATFLTSSTGTYFNRLQLVFNSADLGSVQITGCGVLGTLADLTVIPLVSSRILPTINAALSKQFCGASGPELFGQCP